MKCMEAGQNTQAEHTGRTHRQNTQAEHTGRTQKKQSENDTHHTVTSESCTVLLSLLSVTLLCFHVATFRASSIILKSS